MRQNRIKKVITKKGKIIYYIGDGFWFGRCSKAEAENGLNNGSLVLWDTVSHYNVEPVTATVH